MSNDTLPSTAPTPVKFTVKVSELADPKHFEDGVEMDLAEVCKLMELNLAIEDLESEHPTAGMLAWASWVWVRREYVPGMTWEDAQERIRLVFE